MNNKPDISVIIVNYRTPELTCKAIESVFKAKSNVSKEVLVVDNNSGDDSLDIILSNCGERITLIENKNNEGFARANNIAMRRASGRYYLLLNSDAEFIDDSIQKMLDYVRDRNDIGILGCSIKSPNGERQASCWRSPRLAWLFWRALGLCSVLPDNWLGSTNFHSYGVPNSTKFVEVVSGCVMLINSEIAEKVGLFDERFFMYSEDTDWCARMRKNGYKVCFYADASVKHYGGGTSANLFEEMKIEQMRSILQYIHKEKGLLHTYVANFLLMTFFIIRMPVWSLLFILGVKRKISGKMMKTYKNCFWWHLRWYLKEGPDSLVKKRVPEVDNC